MRNELGTVTGNNDAQIKTLNQCLDSFDFILKSNFQQEVSTSRPVKKFRLYRCFACEKCYTHKKMSNALVICKACYASVTAKNKGRIARNNIIEKILSDIQKFLRRRVAV